MNLNDLRPTTPEEMERIIENLKLKDFRPISLFNTSKTIVPGAKYPAIDMHTHPWQKDTDVSEWVKRMDASNITRSIVLSFETGAGFDEIMARYSAFPHRFDIWCGFDYTGYDQPGTNWTDHSIAELERCYKKGAKGVGELGDKGLGEFYSSPVPGYGMHLNDARFKPLLQKCAQLGLPVSVHIADPIWMYHPMNIYNDGLMNAYKWRIDLTRNGILHHAQLITGFEEAVSQHPDTTFIACHLANCSHDLDVLGKMLDKYANLYTDITSRLKEVATVPRYARAFFERYQDRLLFGTDLGYDPNTTMDIASELYKATFRLLESSDEHIYEHDLFKYHWPLYGLDLSDSVLRKLYQENAMHLLNH
jgi:predicted TIM-barrel fold metal-dependent hydrolase